jgi:holo-[acyl-carrier protein] synthase
MTIPLRTGIDLLEIQRIRDLNPAIRIRFLKRVFTPLELELCHNSDASLAGRFAAKEAVAKALGSGIGAVGWQTIEIGRGSNGEPELQLHGAAAELALSLGLTQWAISITHSHNYAAAIAIAMGDKP